MTDTLKCRVNPERDCPGGSTTCGFICAGYFPERAAAVNRPTVSTNAGRLTQMKGSLK